LGILDHGTAIVGFRDDTIGAPLVIERYGTSCPLLNAATAD
jgi:hypothetical protein